MGNRLGRRRRRRDESEDSPDEEGGFETLPKAQRTRGRGLSHITSSNTNLDQILESLLSTISTKFQHLAET